MARDPLRHYIDEAIVAVFYYAKEGDKLKGFIIFSDESVKQHIKMEENGLNFTLEGSPYIIDSEFYAEYGVACKDEQDLYRKAKRFKRNSS
jgi:hypothetical protein